MNKIIWIAGISIASMLVAGFLVIGVSPTAIAGNMIWPALGEIQKCQGTEAGAYQHVDKIRFHTELVNLKGEIVRHAKVETVIVAKFRPMDIKVADDQFRPTVLDQTVADTLNQMGWTTQAGNPIQHHQIFVDDVEYAVYCTSTPIFPSVIGPEV